MMGISRPTEHTGTPPGFAQAFPQPSYNQGQLSHHQPPQIGHPHFTSQYHHHPMRHMSNNQSLDASHMPGMGGMEGDHRSHVHQLRPHHHYSQSYGGPMHHMIGHGSVCHYGHGNHGQLQGKRSYDLTMMDPKIPVGLHGDPYLSEHARQASHDSGLGYPVTPYQTDQNMMDFDEGYEAGLHTVGHVGTNQGVTQEPNIQGASNHSLLDQLPGAGEMDQQQAMDFGSDMLDFSNQGNNHLFGAGQWV